MALPLTGNRSKLEQKKIDAKNREFKNKSQAQDDIPSHSLKNIKPHKISKSRYGGEDQVTEGLNLPSQSDPTSSEATGSYRTNSAVDYIPRSN